MLVTKTFFNYRKNPQFSKPIFFVKNSVFVYLCRL